MIQAILYDQSIMRSSIHPHDFRFFIVSRTELPNE